MMEEETGFPGDVTSIADELIDAAQTDVTQGGHSVSSLQPAVNTTPPAITTTSPAPQPGSFHPPQPTTGQAGSFLPPQSSTVPVFHPGTPVTHSSIVSGHPRQYPVVMPQAYTPGSPQALYPLPPPVVSPMPYQPPTQQANLVYQPSPQEMFRPTASSAAVDLGADLEAPQAEECHQHQHTKANFLGGFFAHGSFMDKVMEKTKTFSENVITTLDPGMKQYLACGGPQILVTSSKAVKIESVREAFQQVFGRADVLGMASQPATAPQPVGYSSAMKAAEERIEHLRRSGQVHERQVMVSVENFIVEVVPDRWYDIGCLLLRDPAHSIELYTFTQATPVPLELVQQAQQQTPPTYDLAWSGLAVTVGEIIHRSAPHIDHTDWHAAYTGVSRRQLIHLAARALAFQYKQGLAMRGGQ